MITHIWNNGIIPYLAACYDFHKKFWLFYEVYTLGGIYVYFGGDFVDKAFPLLNLIIFVQIVPSNAINVNWKVPSVVID